MDRTLPPAAVYHLMASLLPESYFTTPPPIDGVRFTVAGSDGIPTTWDLPVDLAEQVGRVLTERKVQHRRSPYSTRS